MATNLLHVERTATDGYRYAKFKAIFELIDGSMPTKQEVTAAQLQAGYHPAGYGGPYDIVHVKNSAPRDPAVPTCETTFRCSGSCD